MHDELSVVANRSTFDADTTATGETACYTTFTRRARPSEGPSSMTKPFNRLRVVDSAVFTRIRTLMASK